MTVSLTRTKVAKRGRSRCDMLLKPFTFYTTQDRMFLVAEKKPSNDMVDDITQSTTTFMTSSTARSCRWEVKNNTSNAMSSVFMKVVFIRVTDLLKKRPLVGTSLLKRRSMTVVLSLVLEPTLRTLGLVSGPPKVARSTRFDMERVVFESRVASVRGRCDLRTTHL